MYVEQILEEISKKLKELGDKVDNIHLTPEPEVLDNQDVMQLLKISTRTLQNYRDAGILPFYKVEGKIYYKRKEIMAAIEKHRHSW